MTAAASVRTGIDPQRATGLAVGVLVGAIAFYGFGQSAVRSLIVQPHGPPPLILHVHVLLASAWIVMFVVQSALVSARNVRLHRQLGLWGLALGMALSLVSLATVFAMRRFDITFRGEAHQVAFLAVPLFSCLSFAIPFALAAIWRKQAPYHRRLMILATLTLMDAALARVPGMEGGAAPWGLIIILSTMAIVAGIDWAQTKRLHPVYAWGLPLFIAFGQLATWLAYSEPKPWVALAHLMLGLG